MALHTLQSIQRFPVSLQEVWDFYSNPANLQRITPASMKFNVTSKMQGDVIHPGQLIEYRVTPLWGIPVYWLTEITHVQAPYYFTDEQRKGPYSFWQHQHHFREIEGGVEMRDLIHYRIPMGFLGDALMGSLVKRKLREIFDYRYKVVEGIFGVWR